MHIHSALLIYLCDITLQYMIIYGTWRSHYGEEVQDLSGFLPHSINMHISWIGKFTIAPSVFVCVYIFVCAGVCCNRPVTSPGCSATPRPVTGAPLISIG